MSGDIDVVGLLVPVFLVIALGYLSGRLHEFDAAGTAALTTLVITVALPASLFVGTVTTSRAVLLGDLPLFGVLAAALVGLFAVAVVVLRLLRIEIGDAAILALAATQPTFSMMGLPVLSGVFGPRNAAEPIAIAGILVNVVMIPATLVLIGLGEARAAAGDGRQDEGETPAERGGGGATRTAVPARQSTARIVGRAFAKPLAWLPISGMVIVLIGLPVPEFVRSTLNLVGGAASGVALFSVGLILTLYRIRLSWVTAGVLMTKVVVQPLAALGLAVAFGLAAQQVGESAITVAFPTSAVVVALAAQAGLRVAEISSALVLGVIASAATLPALIALTT